MLVFGGALTAALGKGIAKGVKRRKWPKVPGTVKLAASRDGKKNALALINYKIDGQKYQLETNPGGLSSAGLHGKEIHMAVNPSDHTDALPASTTGNLVLMGFFAFVSALFAVIGLLAVIYVLTK